MMMIAVNTTIGYDDAGGDQCECECECNTKSLLSKGDQYRSTSDETAHLLAWYFCQSLLITSSFPHQAMAFPWVTSQKHSSEMEPCIGLLKNAHSLFSSLNEP